MMREAVANVLVTVYDVSMIMSIASYEEGTNFYVYTVISADF
jgi:hypothetical protein